MCFEISLDAGAYDKITLGRLQRIPGRLSKRCRWLIRIVVVKLSFPELSVASLLSGFVPPYMQLYPYSTRNPGSPSAQAPELLAATVRKAPRLGRLRWTTLPGYVIEPPSVDRNPTLSSEGSSSEPIYRPRNRCRPHPAHRISVWKAVSIVHNALGKSLTTS